MKIKFVWQKKLKEDAIENKIKIEKLIKKNKGQNQKKNNLKKWYKNMKGQTWISRRKEKKKCRQCIGGSTTARTAYEERGGWDELNDPT
jgi:DNA primase catalytic subunit